MREYAKVSPKFWTGDTGSALSRRGSEALVVALYLMTSPHSNMLGLYYQPTLYMAEETGLTPEGAQKGLEQCMAEGFCDFDPVTRFVWVFEMASYQIASVLKKDDKRCKGIQKDYDALPNVPFLGPFFDHYARQFHLTGRRQYEPKTGLHQLALLSPIEAPSKQGAGAGAGEGTSTGAGLAPTNVGARARRSAEPPELPGIEGTEGGKAKAKSTLPACPHLDVLKVWAEVLPAMPQHNPEHWTGARRTHLQTRWRETAVSKKWTTQEQGLAYFRKLFGYVGQSQFLTGRVPQRDPNRNPFVIELEWLVRPTNWARVIEGKYHQEA